LRHTGGARASEPHYSRGLRKAGVLTSCSNLTNTHAGKTKRIQSELTRAASRQSCKLRFHHSFPVLYAAHRIRYLESRERDCLKEYHEQTRHLTLQRVEAWLQGTSASFAALRCWLTLVDKLRVKNNKFTYLLFVEFHNKIPKMQKAVFKIYLLLL
jgi:hypothetical protein